MTAKIVTDYLKDRADGEKGLRAPNLEIASAQLKALPVAEFDYEVKDKERKGFLCRVRKSESNR